MSPSKQILILSLSKECQKATWRAATCQVLADRINYGGQPLAIWLRPKAVYGVLYILYPDTAIVLNVLIYTFTVFKTAQKG